MSIGDSTRSEANTAMLFGHVESVAQRVDHLKRLRHLKMRRGVHELCRCLTARKQLYPCFSASNRVRFAEDAGGEPVVLDNFDHITAYWVGMGLGLAQVGLSYGADDLHGTIVEEKIFQMAGAASGKGRPEAELVKAIREAGRDPVQRDTFYQSLAGSGFKKEALPEFVADSRNC